MMDFKYNCGDKVVDKVTDFEGIIEVRSEWLNGCIRYGVRTKFLKDGLPQDLYWMDEEQLKLVEGSEALKIENRTGGGGRQDPMRGF